MNDSEAIHPRSDSSTRSIGLVIGRGVFIDTITGHHDPDRENPEYAANAAESWGLLVYKAWITKKAELFGVGSIGPAAIQRYGPPSGIYFEAQPDSVAMSWHERSLGNSDYVDGLVIPSLLKATRPLYELMQDRTVKARDKSRKLHVMAGDKTNESRLRHWGIILDAAFGPDWRP
jgi:hypothetical protein